MNKITEWEYLHLLSENARKKNIPINGCFELTPLCNLDCQMCYVHMNDATIRQKMLSGAEWISVMKEAIRGGMLFALLTGGEAMTHPDFWEIFDFLCDQGIRVRLKTNGLLLSEENVKRLVSRPPQSVDISVYGCDSGSYLAVTGHDAFQTVDTNIRRAIDAGLNVQLMLTPSRPMMPWFDAIFAYVKSFGCAMRMNELLFPPRKETKRAFDDFELSREEYLYIARKQREIETQRILAEEPEEKPTAAHMQTGLRCGGGRSHFSVQWNGTMTACINFPTELLGADVRKTGFDAAWQTINRGVREFPVPEDCRVCTYNTICNYCPIHHGANALHYACDPAYCAMRRCLIDMKRNNM